ncbi:MAG: DUF3788 domain-containing protein [Terriglobales bacterium]
MEPNAFVGKKTKPTDRELALALGPTYQLWQALLDQLHLTAEWNSYSPKAGWSLKLKQKQRTILYLGPCKGSFRASFVLGAKAIEAARACGLPQPVLRLISEAKKYPEGTAVRFERVEAEDLASIAALARIKLDH